MGETAQKKPTQEDLDARVEAEYAAAQFDRSPGGRLDQLLKSKDPAVQAAIRRRLGKRLAQQKAEAAEKARQKAAHDKVHGAAHPDAVDTAEAPVVDGAPTNNPIHYDDESIEITKVDPKNKVGYRDGAGHVERGQETTVSSGENKTVDSKVHDFSVGKDGAGYEQRKAHEDAVGEDTSHKVSTAVGGNASWKGADAHYGREAETQMGDDKRKHALDAKAHVGIDGKVEAEGGRTVTTENAHGTTTDQHKAGYSDGQLTYGHAHAETHKLDEKDEYGNQKQTSRSSNSNVRVGTDKVGADHAINTVNKEGTATSASAGVDIGKDGVSAHAGYSIITKGGTSATMSASHGTKVYAEDPVKVGDHWEVQYVRTTETSGNAGGGKKGGGFSAEGHAGARHDSFESGVRTFKSEKEAKDFKEHAADKVEADAISPTSVEGALAIPVGESRGVGKTDGLSAGGSISFEGSSIGGEGHESSTQECAIKRVSDKLVDVTAVRSSEHGKDLNVSGGPVSGNWGTEDTRGKAITYRFDLSTKEGKAAFLSFSKTGIPPSSGGERIRVERTASHEDHDKFAVTGLGSDTRKSTTSEDHVEDQQGKHDSFKGEKSQDVDPSWIDRKLLGDAEEHYKVDLTSRMENGKEDGYTATMKVSGGSGDYNRQKMNQLTLEQDGKHGATKASGEWSMAADLSKAKIHELERDVPAFRAARTTEEKMRILSEMAAKYGPQMLVGKGNFDVELKGDRHFPGRAGREALEAEAREMIKELTTSPAASKAIVDRANTTIAQLQGRRVGVADTSNYTDLPDGVRAAQLTLIDRHIHDFTSIRTNALMQAERNTPGESIDKVHAREADPHAFARLSADEQQLARWRDQIADKDDRIRALFVENAQADKAVQAALHSYKANKKNARPLGEALESARALDKRADEKDRVQAAFDAPIASLRLALFSAQGAARLSTAAALVALLEQKRKACEDCLEFRKLAAEAMLNFASDRARADNALFWNKLPMPDDDSDAEGAA